MSMQTDVLVSVPITGTGQFTNQTPSNLGRTRVKAVYMVPTASAGSVIFKDGGSGGTGMFSFTAPAAAGSIYMIFPGEGIRCNTNISAVVAASTTAVVFYG